MVSQRFLVKKTYVVHHFFSHLLQVSYDIKSDIVHTETVYTCIVEVRLNHTNCESDRQVFFGFCENLIYQAMELAYFYHRLHLIPKDSCDDVDLCSDVLFDYLPKPFRYLSDPLLTDADQLSQLFESLRIGSSETTVKDKLLPLSQ